MPETELHYKSVRELSELIRDGTVSRWTWWKRVWPG